jgi:CcmD family protein
MSVAAKYVAAAYGVVFAVVLVWVLIMSTKLVRLRNEVEQLATKQRDSDG